MNMNKDDKELWSSVKNSMENERLFKLRFLIRMHLKSIGLLLKWTWIKVKYYVKKAFNALLKVISSYPLVTLIIFIVTVATIILVSFVKIRSTNVYNQSRIDSISYKASYYREIIRMKMEQDSIDSVLKVQPNIEAEMQRQMSPTRNRAKVTESKAQSTDTVK